MMTLAESYRPRWLRLMLLLLSALLLMPAAAAQGDAVSDTEVIQVAARMYCPVCENIPLDECQTVTCSEWKEEIRRMLAAGRSAAEVIDSFVTRFGDDVVGVPQDPLLRALTLLLPMLGTLLAIAIGIATFRRFGRQERLRLPREPSHDAITTDDEYRQRLEADLRARR